ncbi:MAG: type II toxin-antitoxin system RelE/ParE family toxin [Candidatus Omnitrophica bacterium]|nr:type II toxin-antitoxin system RelE/ParE family toxin [Candidatus Omnitrophota bacterium]
MIYKVTIDRVAKSEIDESFRYILQDSRDRAIDWLTSLFDKIEALSEMPRRFGFAREDEFEPEELRQFVHFSHRVVYTVLDDTQEVIVLHVRHAARQNFNQDALED